MLVNLNWVKNKNDSISEKYLVFTGLREKLDYIRSIIAEQKLSDPEVEIKSLQKIIEEIPCLKKYSKKEIDQEASKYTYKNIIRVLKEIDNNSDSATTFYGILIREYSELSSFVHGGDEAHQQMFELNNEIERRDEYFRICGLAYQMAMTVKLISLLMLVQTDKEEFSMYYIRVDKLMIKVIEIGN